MAKVLIVGAGVSGLSAGIYSCLFGHEVTICERHKRAGGNLTGWQRGEFHIDNCIHWLTGTNPMTDNYKTWCELGALGNVEIYQGESLYTCERNGKRLSLYRSLDRLEKEMLALSPCDKKEILSLTEAVRLVSRLSSTGGVYKNEGISVPRLVLKSPKLLKYCLLSTGELSKRFSHPLIRDLIVSVLGECFSAMALIVVFSTFTSDNGGIPHGSSVGMAERMKKRFLDLGGELKLSCEAECVNSDGTRAVSVDFKDGRRIFADYIILATDPRISYEKLLNSPLPVSIAKAFRDTGAPSFSSFHTAFAVDAEGLPFSGDFAFEIPKREQRFLHTKYLILREFSHEPDFSPKGKSLMQTLTFCDSELSQRFIRLYDNREKYDGLKARIAECIERLVCDKFPELSGKLSSIDVWTPATYKRYTGAPGGEYMSCVLAPRRLPCRIKSESGVYPNVFIATQWQRAPGGLPIAAEVGKMAAEAVEKFNSGKR